MPNKVTEVDANVVVTKINGAWRFDGLPSAYDKLGNPTTFGRSVLVKKERPTEVTEEGVLVERDIVARVGALGTPTAYGARFTPSGEKQHKRWVKKDGTISATPLTTDSED